MADKGKVTRREFIKGVASTGALVYASGMASVKEAFSQGDKSRIFRAGLCPRHDGRSVTRASTLSWTSLRNMGWSFTAPMAIIRGEGLRFLLL